MYSFESSAGFLPAGSVKGEVLPEGAVACACCNLADEVEMDRTAAAGNAVMTVERRAAIIPRKAIRVAAGEVMLAGGCTKLKPRARRVGLLAVPRLFEDMHR